MLHCAFHKIYATKTAKFKLDVDFNIKAGSFYAIYGTSGAGKTTILKLLSGLLIPDTGSISFNNTIWYSSIHKTSLPPQKRSIGYLFQEYALFPNMNVKQNLLYALGKGDTSFFDEIVALTKVKELLYKSINELSGGQKQRVALARTLLTKPKLLLLDEPFTALDIASKKTLIACLKLVHTKYKLTTIMVSHSIKEITSLADSVLCIENGKIITHGKPQDIFNDNEHTNTVTGKIVAISNTGIQVLLPNNTVLKVNVSDDEIKHLKIDDLISVTPTEYKIKKK